MNFKKGRKKERPRWTDSKMFSKPVHFLNGFPACPNVVQSSLIKLGETKRAFTHERMKLGGLHAVDLQLLLILIRLASTKSFGPLSPSMRSCVLFSALAAAIHLFILDFVDTDLASDEVMQFFFTTYQVTRSVFSTCPRGLTFSWRGCYGLCPRHKPVALARSFYSARVSVSVFMTLATEFHSIKFSRQLSAFPLCSSGLNSALLVL